MPGFEQLEQVARENGVKVYRSVMSLSGGINLGQGDSGAGVFAARE